MSDVAINDLHNWYKVPVDQPMDHLGLKTGDKRDRFFRDVQRV